MIGGNATATIQQRGDSYVDEFGGCTPMWNTLLTLTGWLDLMSGEAKYTYDTKLQESTHVFLCDYVEMGQRVHDKRMVIGNAIYDILLIDDPMGMHQHLEIYLRYVGE